MPVVETETFMVHRDVHFPEKWMIKPLDMSELWLAVFGEDWDMEFYEEEDIYEFEFFYERLLGEWEKAADKYGEDILICEVEVEYWFSPPPGLRSLRYGRYVGASREEFWSILGGEGHYPKVVGGFVRAIRVVPLSERDHNGRREQGPRGREVRVV
jgi:hypothetical protein